MIRQLGVGCIGPDVREVQNALNRRINAGLVPDAVFGSHTQAAVWRFQQAYGLETDGVLGSETRSVLFPLVGLTVHAVGAYAGLDLPIGRRGPLVAAPRGGSRSSIFRQGALLASAGTSLPVGDVPDPNPLQLPIPDFLKNLPFGRDPSTGPLDRFRLSGMDLPIPPLLTGLLIPIPGFQLDSQQIQPGAQFTTRPLSQTSSGSSNPSGAFVFAVQTVLKRNKDKPKHFEIAQGFQVGTPFVAKSADGLDWSLQWFGQLTYVDQFWDRGLWHLVQPFAQVSSQIDLKTGGVTLGAGIFPANISFDVVKNKVSIFGQGGIVAGWDTMAGRAELGAQTIVGANITIGSSD